MPAFPSYVFNRGLELTARQEAGLLTADTILVLLMRDTYTPARDQLTVADIVAAELGVTGYARKVLANASVTRVDAPSNWAYLDGDDLQWDDLAAGDKVRYVVLAHEGANDGARALISAHAFAADIDTGGVFPLGWPAPALGGILLFQSPQT